MGTESYGSATVDSRDAGPIVLASGVSFIQTGIDTASLINFVSFPTAVGLIPIDAEFFTELNTRIINGASAKMTRTPKSM